MPYPPHTPVGPLEQCHCSGRHVEAVELGAGCPTEFLLLPVVNLDDGSCNCHWHSLPNCSSASANRSALAADSLRANTTVTPASACSAKLDFGQSTKRRNSWSAWRWVVAPTKQRNNNKNSKQLGMQQLLAVQGPLGTDTRRTRHCHGTFEKRQYIALL